MMCEVTRLNFEALYPELVRVIAGADLLAFDMEFTGIDLVPVSLFDNCDERYRRARASVQQTTLLQVGLAAFTRLSPSPDGAAGVPDRGRHLNTYLVRAYNFVLFPSPYEPLQESFVVQSSALSFLRRHELDLNACVDRGLSFLNARGETHARKHLESLNRAGPLSGKQEDIVRACSLTVAEGLAAGKEEVVLELPAGMHPALMQLELRDRFQEAWTEADGQGKIIVRRVSEGKRQELAKSEAEMADGSLKKTFLLELIGFTRIIRTIINMKKPLVGHNCYSDILHLYDKFVRPLPPDFATFKADFHRLLPHFFDTRFIIQEVRSKYPDLKQVLSDARSLDEVFRCVKDDSVENEQLTITLPPHFEFGSESSRYDGASLPHEAGYDAMMAGCVLLHLGHRIAFPPGQQRELVRAGQLNFEVYRHALLPLVNQINLIQAAVDSFSLEDGTERASSKPPCLVIRRRSSPDAAAFSCKALEELLEAFGRADLRPFGADAALVRFNNFSSYRLLRRDLKEDRDLMAEVYQPLRHCAALRRGVVAGAVVSTLISAYSVTSLLVESWVMAVLHTVRAM